MRALAALLLLAMAPAFTAAPALAQQAPPQRDRGGWQKGAAKPPPGRMAEPVRGGDARRPERMSPEDRERLRRDIDDANRRIERPGRR